MKNLSKKIIMSVIVVAIFLAPVSGGIKVNNNGHLALKIEKNEALAINVTDIFQTSTLNVVSTNSNSATFSGELVVGADKQLGAKNLVVAYDKVAADSSGAKAIYFVVKDSSGVEKGKILFVRLQAINFTLLNNPFLIDTKNITSDFAKPLLLQSDTTYTLSLRVEGTTTNGSWEILKTFKTTKYNANDPTNNFNGINQGKDAYGQGDFSLGCTSFTSVSLSACIAQVTFIVWTVSALIARLAAHFLDFFVYYSTNSSSYNNEFVKQAWAAVRDIANIFFIIALLYVAIKTILGLNVTDNKKLIGAVIIVALIINFSLFTTELIIDGSNILAKIFYNNITPVNENGGAAIDIGGQKSISVGIVDKFNPQGLVTQKSYTDNPYTFIFMTLLLIVMILYMSYIFFSIALLFVGRVVGLWLYMIFSPIAFASYTVKFKVPGFGHEEWWKQLINNALLAPVFIFFLYIIILFTGFLKDIISYTDSPNLDTMANIMQRLMSVTIPFVIIYILLKKAKELAVEYSGEIGAGITKFGAMAGGMALGAGAGMAAFGLRNTAGRVAANLAENERFRGWASKTKIGTSMLNAAGGIASGSFDVRGIKVGGKGLANTGLTNLGKAQAGGFAKARAEKVKTNEEFTSKMIDTSDFGKAKMIQGHMSDKEALAYEEQMKKGGMSDEQALINRLHLTGGGLSAAEAKEVARYVNAGKREFIATRLEKSKFMTNKISANKIRKDVATQEKEQNLQNFVTQLAKVTAEKEKLSASSPATPTTHTPTTNTGGSAPAANH